MVLENVRLEATTIEELSNFCGIHAKSWDEAILEAIKMARTSASLNDIYNDVKDAFSPFDVTVRKFRDESDDGYITIDHNDFHCEDSEKLANHIHEVKKVCDIICRHLKSKYCIKIEKNDISCYIPSNGCVTYMIKISNL